MENSEKIKNNSESADCRVQIIQNEHGLAIEAYLNKQSNELERLFIKGADGGTVNFIDYKSLKGNKDFIDLIKSHYQKQGLIIKDAEAKDIVEEVANEILREIDENLAIIN